MAALLAAGDELAYRNAPVEARLNAASLRSLKTLVAPDPYLSAQAPTPFPTFTGIRLIVDPEMPPNRIEFRDRDGSVTARFDLPAEDGT